MIFQVPEKLIPAFQQWYRYVVLHGGRAGTKSWAVAGHLATKAAFSKTRILCTREMQNSIRDSVYRLLVDRINGLELNSFFDIQKDSIYGVYGSEFIFKGLHHNISEIKSLEGIDIVWVEEAEKVLQTSWDILIPTIRKEKSQFFITFNPEDEKAAAYQMFVVNPPPPESMVIEISYLDNPWFPEVLRKEMEYCKRVDPEKYEHVWLGKTKRYSEAVIFKRVRVEDFITPSDVQLYFGMDFGFSQDPCVLVRMWMKDNRLYIDYEAYGIGVEIEQLESFCKSVPGAFRDSEYIPSWEIVADSERPDTINYLLSKGFNIRGAEKGKGSVEDGIEFLRSFEEIVIHPRCKGAIDNFRNYKWKQDKITQAILPIPDGGSDHVPDACRYALERYIKKSLSAFDVLAGRT